MAERFVIPRIVEEIMTRPVVTIGPGETATEAATKMAEAGVGCLVVVEGETVLGIVTERDLVTRIVSKGKDAKKVKVQDFMSSPVISVSPETRILDAVKIVSRHRIRRLPVVKDGKLVGIITAYDAAIYGWGMPTH